MKIHTAQRQVKSSGLENVHTTFKIKQNASMFRLLSDKMYSNKPLAILREIYANAVDAHIEAGTTDTPIVVVLPSDFKSVLTIKDFGTGMSHDIVMTLFSTYGDTTKGDTNDLIGGFGIGSKSPFSYTDSFTVESRYNGELRTYNAYIGVNGEPAITMMGEMQLTDEPNGITYQIPVKPNDVSDFRDEARTVFKYFSMVPDVKGNNGTFAIDRPTYEIVNDVFGISTSHSSRYSYSRNYRVNAIMGNIAYPLDFSAVKADEEYDRDLVTFFNRLSLDMDLFFDIGDLDIAASREALSYDKQTQECIIAKLNVIRERVLADVTSKVAGATSKWNAHILMGNLKNSLELIPSSQRKVSWYGHDIGTALTVPIKKSLHGSVRTYIISAHRFRQKTLSLYNNRVGNCSVMPKDTRVLRIKSTDKRVPSRTLRWAKEKWNGRINLFVIETDNDTEAWYYIHQVLGNPKVYTMDDVPDYSVIERKLNKSLGSPTKATGLYSFYAKYPTGPKSYWDSVPDAVDLDAETGYYVDVRNYSVLYGDKTMPPDQFKNVILLARKLDIIDCDTVVYGVNGSKKNLMKDHDNWTNLITLLHKKARFKHMKTDNSDVDIQKQRFESLHSLTNYTIFSMLDEERIKPTKVDSPFALAQKVYKEGYKVDVSNPAKDLLSHLDCWFKLPYIHKGTKDSKGTTVPHLKLDTTYPMLTMANHRYGELDYGIIVEYINSVDTKGI